MSAPNTIPAVRAPVDFIVAPTFPLTARWINVASLRMEQQYGRPVLIEFWDFCRPNSLRTLPYLKAWHARYAEAGLRVIGVHASGFAPSADLDAVRAAVERLEIDYPVMVDADFELWKAYANVGWPARYLFNGELMLFDYHYGEGGYEETEAAIRELLGLDPDAQAPVPALRPEDVAGALLSPQTEDVPGPYRGPYEAGGVWGVFDAAGTVRVNGVVREIPFAGAHELIHHEVSASGTLELELSDGLSCLATCFTPGLADSEENSP